MTTQRGAVAFVYSPPKIAVQTGWILGPNGRYSGLFGRYFGLLGGKLGPFCEQRCGVQTVPGDFGRNRRYFAGFCVRSTFAVVLSNPRSATLQHTDGVGIEQ